MSKDLITKAKEGNKDALNELINNHKELVFSVALKYLKNKSDAEDVTQDCFIIVLKSLKNFRNESKFSTWLFSIVYHECLKNLKNKNKTIEYVPGYITMEIEETIKKEDINVESYMKTLTPNEYLVINLFYLKEKSLNDIVKITDMSKANVKVLLHRARLKMKVIINEKEFL